MNMDNVKGKLNEAKGALKKGVGQATDDPALVAEGTLDQAKGKAQQVKGHIKDAVRDATR